MLKKVLILLSMFISAGFVPTKVRAATECSVNISRIWAGDGGMIWIFTTTGGAAVIAPNDPNREAALSLAITAMTTGRKVTVRYTENNVSCASTRYDFLGLFLESN